MNEGDWLTDIQPFEMIKFVENQQGSSRRLRLFACACCRRTWDLLQNESARELVALTEQYADGQLNEALFREKVESFDFKDLPNQLLGKVHESKQLTACASYAIYAARDLILSPIPILQIVLETSRNLANDYIPKPGFNETTGRGTGYDAKEIANKTELLRDIFGNPFRFITFEDAWRTDKVIALADQMYQSRDFSSMPTLAKLLHDSGCDNEVITNHCRSEFPHSRGCWVVDLILKKN